MIELKYFKNIHARIINTRKNAFGLNDACVYADKDNNRYCYLTISNKVKDELLSILFHVRQYDSTGQFLKEGKFYIPNCYHPCGAFEIDEPIPVEKECDAVEIFVERALFVTKALYNDRIVSIRSVPEAFGKVQHTVVPASSGFTFPASQAPTKSEPEAPKAAVVEETKPSVEEKPAEEVEPKEEVLAESAPANEEVVEAPAETPSPAENEGKPGSYKIIQRPFWVIPLAIGIVLIIFLVIVYFLGYNILVNEGLLK